MSGLRLRALRLRVSTDDGEFGADLRFEDGLNVLGAPNTSGKSTCVQAILFALGLEGMLGPGRDVPLPHVMTHSLDDIDGSERAVVQSEVSLEVLDGEGAPLTIRRYPHHPSIDRNLVSVWNAGLSSLEAGDRQDFYVRRSGSAQREAGFHHFLAQRLGWELPEVPRFSGGMGPLYLETLAPLWFVEQKRGWGGIQAQTPTYLQIRDVRRRALEFTLDLDVQERARRIEQLLVEQRGLEAEWASITASVGRSAEALGVAVAGLPARPTADWPGGGARLQVANPEGWSSLDDELREAREELEQLRTDDVMDALQAAPAEERQLTEMQDYLGRLSAMATNVARQLELEEGTAADARARLAAVEEDIRRHQDLLILQGMGSDVAAIAEREDCPTCHKPLDGVLLNPDDVPAVLAADASLEVLGQRRSLLGALARDADRVVAAQRSRMTALRSTASDLRSSIRALKDSLTSPSQRPSVAVLERRLTLGRRIEALGALRDEWEVALDRLGEIAGRWAQVLAELKDLRQSEFSPTDRAKLTALEDSFREQLAEYAFSSCPVDQVILSLDDYMPTHEGFELSLDFSASDGIRVIWAYLIGLLGVSRSFSTNHPGLVMFDEPRQQAAAELSFSALLHRAAAEAGDGGQVVFATSEAPQSLDGMLDGVDAHRVQFDGKIIRRL